jgi:protein SCO1/2
MKNICNLIFIILGFVSCNNTDHKLPILGKPVINGNDTIYPRINPFSFINQDSIVVTEKTFRNKIYVADFIFLSCPTICPKMNSELLNVYNEYKNDTNILFLSHTIDPEHDTIPRLKEYAKNLGINNNKWFFVTGNKDSIYSIAKESYYATAYADSTEPGDYVHSGGLLLIDKNRHIRGVYDGTNPKETKRLIKDIELLLKEQFN